MKKDKPYFLYVDSYNKKGKETKINIETDLQITWKKKKKKKKIGQKN